MHKIIKKLKSFPPKKNPRVISIEQEIKAARRKVLSLKEHSFATTKFSSCDNGSLNTIIFGNTNRDVRG